MMNRKLEFFLEVMVISRSLLTLVCCLDSICMDQSQLTCRCVRFCALAAPERFSEGFPLSPRAAVSLRKLCEPL